MFTGLIEEVGVITSISRVGEGRRIRVEAPRVTTDARIGDSIAIDGACQTVVDLDDDGFSVDAIGTTLSRTTFGSFEAGREVNLERAMRLGERIGGHLVQGHVDGVGEIVELREDKEKTLIDLRLPAAVWEATIPHGSIALDGISLTVNAINAPDRIQVAIIPHTLRNTTLRGAFVGRILNVEGDMLGKYVQRLMVARSGPEDRG